MVRRKPSKLLTIIASALSLAGLNHVNATIIERNYNPNKNIYVEKVYEIAPAINEINTLQSLERKVSYETHDGYWPELNPREIKERQNYRNRALSRDEPFIDDETGAVVIPVPSHELPREDDQAVEGFSLPEIGPGIVVYNKDLSRPKKDFVYEHEIKHIKQEREGKLRTQSRLKLEQEAGREAYRRTGYIPRGREAIHPYYPALSR